MQPQPEAMSRPEAPLHSPQLSNVDAPGAEASQAPARRTTSYGLLQELRHFMATRKATFISIFELAANKSRHKRQPLPPGLASRAGIAMAVHRCIPDASEEDLRYVLLLIDAVLPKSNAVSIKDLAYAVKQGAAVEKLVASGRLPPSIRGILEALADQFYSRNRQRVRRAFQDLDWNHTGRLQSHEQAALLHAMVPSLRNSERLWLSCSLHWYQQQEDSTVDRQAAAAAAAAAEAGAKPGRLSPGLTFEELAQALTWLAKQQPAGLEDESRRRHRRESTDEDVGDWQQEEYWHRPLPSHQHPGQAGPWGVPDASSSWMDDQGIWDDYAANQPGGYHPLVGPGLSQVPGGQFAYTYPSGGTFQVSEGPWLQGLDPRVQAEAGDNYCSWVLRSRQKVLEQWFAEDHARKVRVLEEQQSKLQLQKDMRQQIFKLKVESRNIETGMANLARQLERDAYEVTGLPPVFALDLRGLTERVSKTMDQAVEIARARALTEDGVGGSKGRGPAVGGLGDGGGQAEAGRSEAQGGGGGGDGSGVDPVYEWLDGQLMEQERKDAGEHDAGAGPVHRDGESLEALLERLTSSDWLSRARLPYDATTLRTALDVRAKLLQMQRLQRAQELRLEADRQAGEMQVQEARHGLVLQTQVMQGQLDAQTAEMQRQLMWESHALSSASAASAWQQQQVLAGAAGGWPVTSLTQGGGLGAGAGMMIMPPINPVAAVVQPASAATFSFAAAPGSPTAVDPMTYPGLPGRPATASHWAQGLQHSLPGVSLANAAVGASHAMASMAAGLGGVAAWPGFSPQASSGQALLVPRQTSD